MTRHYLPRTALLPRPFRMKSVLRVLFTLLSLVLLCYIYGFGTTTSATLKLQDTPVSIGGGRTAAGRGNNGETIDGVISDASSNVKQTNREKSLNIKFIENDGDEHKRLFDSDLSKQKTHRLPGLQGDQNAPENRFPARLNYKSDSASERSGVRFALNNRSIVKDHGSPETVPQSTVGELLSQTLKALDSGNNSASLANPGKKEVEPGSLLSLLETFLNVFQQPHALDRKDVPNKGTLRDPSLDKLHPPTKHNAQPPSASVAVLKGKPSNTHAHGSEARKLKEASHEEQAAITAKGGSKPRRSGESLSRSPSPHFAPSAANASTETGGAEEHDTATPVDKLPFDPTRRVWVPFRSDASCRRYTVHYTYGAPPRALISYPGSGNTWTRYLIEAASGIHTGSIYQDNQLYLNGYRGEMEPWNSGTTLVQKAHDYSSDLVKSFEGRAVLLLRNPYRAILSFHNFLFGGHKGYAPVSNFRRKDWESFLHMQIKTWLLTAMTWLQESSSLHVLHYEELLQDPAPHLIKLTKDIGAPTNAERLRCIKKHSRGNFKRQKEYLPDDVKVFSKDIREKIDRAIRYVNFLLEKRGQRLLPVSLYEFYNLTLSEQIVRVPCPEGKTVEECDYQVDQLNKESRKHSSDPPPTDAPGSDSPSPPPYLQESGHSTEHAPLEDTRLTVLERLGQNPLTQKLSDAFRDILQPFSANPIKKMLKEPHLKKFLAKPVHFEGVHGEEAKLLAKDYSWHPGTKGPSEGLLATQAEAKEEPK